MSALVSARKDVRAEAKILNALGFTFFKRTQAGKGHPVFHHPRYGYVGLPETPSDTNWRKAHRRDLARVMGLTVADLEALITGQRPQRQSGRKRPARGRRQRTPRALRHLGIAPEDASAPPAPAPVEVKATADWRGPITEKRRDRWAELQRELERANVMERLNRRDAA